MPLLHFYKGSQWNPHCPISTIRLFWLHTKCEFHDSLESHQHAGTLLIKGFSPDLYIIHSATQSGEQFMHQYLC